MELDDLPQHDLMTITPDDAEHLLATKAINRPLKPGHVAYLKRLIELGRWHPTAGTFGVNEGGQLVDGQHRCHAIIEAGKEVEAQIRLIRSADILAVDTGSSRTAGDLFGIRNIERPNETASCIRVVASIRSSVGRANLNTRPGTMLSNEELWEIVREDPNYITAAVVGRAVRETMPFMRASHLAALYYLFAEATDANKAREFLDAVALDTHPEADSLTHTLRRWLLRAEAQRRKPSANHALVLFLNTWNRWVRGERGRASMPKKVPKVAGIPKDSGGDE